MDEAKRLLHQHRIEKLLVVDDAFRCVGLITVRDIEKAQQHPDACKDEKGRLRAAAATGVGEKGVERAEALLEAEVDVIVVDTAHGHARGVLVAVERIKALSNYTQVVAGNVATASGARALIDMGADAIKVGIGPGTICTTRMVAGVGVPQLTAILDTVEECRKHGVPVIADGGIKYSGDIAKAIAAGADCVMIGSLFAAPTRARARSTFTRAAPTRPTGAWDRSPPWSAAPPTATSSRRSPTASSWCPRASRAGPLQGPDRQTSSTSWSAGCAPMGYTGNRTLVEMQKNCTFRRVTAAGLREGHVHDVTITREPPNYRADN